MVEEVSSFQLLSRHPMRCGAAALSDLEVRFSAPSDGLCRLLDELRWASFLQVRKSSLTRGVCRSPAVYYRELDAGKTLECDKEGLIRLYQ